MIPERYLQLMNASLDDDLTPAQQVELDRYLDEHAEARTFFAELQDTIGVVERAGLAAPPPELRGRILDALEREGAPQPAVVHRGRLRPSHGWAVAAGLALGFVLHALLAPHLGGPRQELEMFYGSQIAPDLVDAGRALRPISLAAEGVQGEIRPLVVDGRLILELRLDSTREVVLNFAFVDPVVCEGLNIGPQRDTRIAATDGGLAITSRGPVAGKILLAGFGPHTPPVRLKLSADGETLIDHVMAPPSLAP